MTKPDQTSQPLAEPRSPVSILIADDDESIRKLVGIVLKRSGFAVDSARSGEEAIQKIDASFYDAILLDLNMRPGSGYDVIAHLEAVAPDRLAERVIVLTAVADVELRRLEGKRLFRVVRKPFDLDDLLSIVVDCCSPRGEGAESPVG